MARLQSKFQNLKLTKCGWETDRWSSSIHKRIKPELICNDKSALKCNLNLRSLKQVLPHALTEFYFGDMNSQIGGAESGNGGTGVDMADTCVSRHGDIVICRVKTVSCDGGLQTRFDDF